MTPFEIVVDGTDCGGKTPLVHKLVQRFADDRVPVTTAAPFKDVEVYPLWKSDPLMAARRINDVICRFRDENRGKTVLVWDRGWPTVFVSTESRLARKACLPFPDLTVLLLNTEQTILEKVAKHRLTGEWLLQSETRRRFIAAYQALADNHEPADMIVYCADTDGRFDLEKIAADVVACFHRSTLM